LIKVVCSGDDGSREVFYQFPGKVAGSRFAAKIGLKVLLFSYFTEECNMRELTQHEVASISGAGTCTSQNIDFALAHVAIGAAIATGGLAAWAIAAGGWAYSAWSAYDCVTTLVNDTTLMDQYGCHQVTS